MVMDVFRPYGRASLRISWRCAHIILPYQPRDLEFTGDSGLAETTPRDLYSIFRALRRPANVTHVAQAFILIFTGLRNCPRGTSLFAHLAGSVEEVETVRPEIWIRPGGGLKRQVRNYDAETNRLSPGSYKSVGKAESAQTACICGVSLGEIGGESHSRSMHKVDKVRSGHGRHGLESLCRQHRNDMFSQLQIERFPEKACVAPEEGGKFALIPIGFPGVFGNGKDPCNHGQILNGVVLPEGEVEDLPRRKMKFADNLLIFPEKGGVAGSESDESRIEESSSIDIPPIHGAFSHKFSDRLSNE